MIGKLNRDQGSGVREQKRNDLRRSWRARSDGIGLDSGKAAGLAELAGLAGRRFGSSPVRRQSGVGSLSLRSRAKKPQTAAILLKGAGFGPYMNQLTNV
jgi:hypothetical protein